MNSALIENVRGAIRNSLRSLIRDYYEIISIQQSPGLQKFSNTAIGTSLRQVSRELQKYNYGLNINNKLEIAPPESGLVWHVQFDGKENFLRANPFFAIVAYLTRHDQFEAVVIHAPLLKEVFWAEKDKEVYFDDSFSQARVRVKYNSTDEESDLSPYTLCHINNSIIRSLPDSDLKFAMSRTQVLSLAHLALGRYDLLLAQLTNMERYLPGLALFKNAGGYYEYDSPLLMAGRRQLCLAVKKKFNNASI